MKKVLVADDKATSRELVRTVLEKCGYEVFEAADGVEALQRAREVRPDLIILDLHMPGVSGIGVVRGVAAGRRIRIHAHHGSHRERDAWRPGTRSFRRVHGLSFKAHPVGHAPQRSRPAITAKLNSMPLASNAALSLLIIDDNEKSLELLSTALAQPDLNILTASDPEVGSIRFSVYNHHPQIVLTDLVMPHLTGMEVLDRIMEFDPSTEVILMTAHYSTESAVEAIKKGANDYLNKPISIAALRANAWESWWMRRASSSTRCSSKANCWPAPNSRELSAAAR